MADPTRSRLGAALCGTPASPPVAGLTFAPPDVLASVAPGCRSFGDCLVEAARALALDFVFVNAAAPWSADVARRAGCGVMWVVDGILWPALGAAGPVVESLKRTVRDPASLAEVLDRETVRATVRIQRGLELGVDAIVLADDLAGTDGLLITPEFAEHELFPRIAGLLELIAGRIPVLLHSDGDIRQLLPGLRDVGFVAVHAGGGLSREGFEQLFWEARTCNLSVVGGIQTSTLGRGTYAALRAGTRVALLAQAGGLVIADDGGITTTEEIEAFAAALGAARGGDEPFGREV
jgi:hypothetical protein